MSITYDFLSRHRFTLATPPKSTLMSTLTPTLSLMLNRIINLIWLPIVEISRTFTEQVRLTTVADDSDGGQTPDLRLSGNKTKATSIQMSFDSKVTDITGLYTKNGLSRQMKGPQEDQEGGMIQSAILGAVNEMMGDYREVFEQLAASHLSSMNTASKSSDREEFASQQRKFFSNLSIAEATLRHWAREGLQQRRLREAKIGDSGRDSPTSHTDSGVGSDVSTEAVDGSDIERELAEDQYREDARNASGNDDVVRENVSQGHEMEWEILPDWFWSMPWED
ncbi:Fc.00g023920.m01.CDS01 [Cosmosporella sp. VM-42]